MVKPAGTGRPIAVISAQEGAHSLQVTDLISKEFQQPCECVPLNGLADLRNRSLVLLDCSCFSPNRIQAWLKELNMGMKKMIGEQIPIDVTIVVSRKEVIMDLDVMLKETLKEGNY